MERIINKALAIAFVALTLFSVYSAYNRYIVKEDVSYFLDKDTVPSGLDPIKAFFHI
jgi:hypothetical protein